MQRGQFFEELAKMALDEGEERSFAAEPPREPEGRVLVMRKELSRIMGLDLEEGEGHLH